MLWEMSTTEWILSLSFFSCISYLSGYMIDRILLSTGFGTIGNWLLVLMGVYLGIYGLSQYGYEMHWYPWITLCATVGSAAAMMLVMCGAKRVLNL